jgi:hypothetical protein
MGRYFRAADRAALGQGRAGQKPTYKHGLCRCEVLHGENGQSLFEKAYVPSLLRPDFL